MVAAGIDRTEVELCLEAGWALGQNVYSVASLQGFATRLSDSYDGYIQVNSYLVGPGFRLYPFHTGLVLGLDGGLAVSMIDSNVATSGNTPTGGVPPPR